MSAGTNPIPDYPRRQGERLAAAQGGLANYLPRFERHSTPDFQGPDPVGMTHHPAGLGISHGVLRYEDAGTVNRPRRCHPVGER